MKLNIDLSSNSDRGQVGIETLVVFIAMILVAALAAGVLINTAGFLQNKASATSEDSQQQVSNQVRIIGAVGTVNVTASGQDNTITGINLSVMQAPGAEEIDLAGATVRYISPNGATTLVYGSDPVSVANSSLESDLTSGTVDSVVVIDGTLDPSEDITPGATAYGESFGVEGVKDGDGSSPVLNSQEDRFQIELELEDQVTVAEYNATSDTYSTTTRTPETLTPLKPGQEATLRVVTMSGAQSTYIVNVPQSLSSSDDGEAVSL